MLNKTAQLQLANTLKQTLKAYYGDRIEKIILFGSYARGEQKADSDIDFLVVFKDEQTNLFQATLDIAKLKTPLSLDYNINISSIPMEATRFEAEDSPLLLNVRNEGIVI